MTSRGKSYLLLATLCAGLGLLIAPEPLQAQDAPAYDHPFFTSPAHEAPEPLFDQQHLRLSLRLNLDGARIDGDATLRLLPLDVALDTLTLHAAGLVIDSVLVGMVDSSKVEAGYRLAEGDGLRIALQTIQDPAAPFEVRVVYHAAPKRGLYSTQPTSEDPAARRQVWTQSMPEDTRYWLPLIDTPGDKLTSELRITADSSLHVLSNGRLIGTQTAGDTKTWHYLQDQPHAPHQILLAAGDYEVVHERAGVPLSYWIYPERIGDATRTFGRTPEMMAFFAEYLGVPYPWDAYAQVVLQRLPVDGMAHTGAATLADHTLIDARAALHVDPDGLIAHALAHQWFGALVTPRYWTDLWLDEGFATYLSALFAEDHDGSDDFALRLLDLADAYFDEAQRYRRPLVWNRWIDPVQLFDAHSAYKGAWVLHVIRRRLGDDAFREALTRYVTAFALKSAETNDLQRSLEVVTDQDFEGFFERWIEGAGHPILEISYAYDDDEQALTITVEQTQTGPRVPEVFPLDLDVDVHTLAERHRFQLPIDARRQSFVFTLPVPPRFVVPDPEQEWLADYAVEQPARAWVAQLRYAPGVVPRIRAARALRAFDDDPALAIGLRNALADEPAAAGRTAIVHTIGQLSPSPSLRRTLMQAMADDDAGVRAAVLDALGSYKGQPEIHALAYEAAQNDRSYRVQAAAVVALARTGSPDALDVVRSALVTPSHREIIRQAAFEALAVLDVPARDGLALALDYSTPDRPDLVRAAAAGYLRTPAEEHRTALDRLIALLNDPAVVVRHAAIHALSAVDDQRARTALSHRRDVESQPLLRVELDQILDSSSTSTNGSRGANNNSGHFSKQFDAS